MTTLFIVVPLALLISAVAVGATALLQPVLL